MLAPWRKSNDKPRQHTKKQTHYIAYKGLYNQKYGFSSSHVWMWKLDNKKGWAWKNWCLWTVVEKTLENSLDSKEIETVNSKGSQSWIFIERTDAEGETPILWPPDAKSWLIWKDPDPGKGLGQKEKGMTEDEMVEWHHQLTGHESEQTAGDSEGRGSLQFIGSAVHRVAKSQTQLRDWTTTKGGCSKKDGERSNESHTIQSNYRYNGLKNWALRTSVCISRKRFYNDRKRWEASWWSLGNKWGGGEHTTEKETAFGATKTWKYTFDKIMQKKPVQRCKNYSGSDLQGRERIVVLPKKRTKWKENEA